MTVNFIFQDLNRQELILIGVSDIAEINPDGLNLFTFGSACEVVMRRLEWVLCNYAASNYASRLFARAHQINGIAFNRGAVCATPLFLN